MRKATHLYIIVLIAFLANTFGPMPFAQAQDFRLPAPGVMVHLSPPLAPPVLKGIKVHPDNPFKFEFILDRGDSQLSNDALKDESTKLIRYFLASLTIPEKDLWVNLSPYEKDRIIPNSFGLTEMGRDLLAEDYMLKQITASLIYPEGETGKKFWKRIYEEAAKKFGTTNIPVNTFNKVWIVPEKAVVYENAKAGTAYVVESKLKVMLEQDYLALGKNQRTLPNELGLDAKATQRNIANALGSDIVREIVLPELTKEVNEDKNFTQLRQVYNSLILAAWYKKKIKDSILEQVYADKNKVAGVSIDDPQEKQKIYERYLRAFKKGVYNYIKEDQDLLTQQIVPRKYFSGGVDYAMFGNEADKTLQITANPAMVGEDGGKDFIVTADFKRAQTNQAMISAQDMLFERLEVALRRSNHGKELLDINGPLITAASAIELIYLYSRKTVSEADSIHKALFGPNSFQSKWYAGNNLATASFEDRKESTRLEAIDYWKEALNGFEEQKTRIESLDESVRQLDKTTDLKQDALDNLEKAIKSLRSGIEIAEGKEPTEITSFNDVLNIIPDQFKIKEDNIEGKEYLSSGIKGNPLSVASVIYNLIVNANQAAEKQGIKSVVTLKLIKEKGGLVAELSDNGPGLPSNFLDKDEATGRKNVFNLNQTGRKEQGGTGLGTTEAYYVLQGKIDAENLPGEKPGTVRGAMFTMHFSDAAMSPNEKRTDWLGWMETGLILNTMNYPAVHAEHIVRGQLEYIKGSGVKLADFTGEIAILGFSAQEFEQVFSEAPKARYHLINYSGDVIQQEASRLWNNFPNLRDSDQIKIYQMDAKDIEKKFGPGYFQMILANGIFSEDYRTRDENVQTVQAIKNTLGAEGVAVLRMSPSSVKSFDLLKEVGEKGINIIFKQTQTEGLPTIIFQNGVNPAMLVDSAMKAKEFISLADPDPAVRKSAAGEFWDLHFKDEFSVTMEGLINNFINPVVGFNTQANRRDARAATLYTLELGIAHNKVFLEGEGLADFQNDLKERLEREAKAWLQDNPAASDVNSPLLANGTVMEKQLLEEYETVPQQYALLENLRLLMLARKNKKQLNIKGIDFVPESIINVISEGNLKKMSPLIRKIILLQDRVQAAPQTMEFSDNDTAMRAQAVNGGIDLTANKTPLEIRNAGQEIKFHLDPAQLAQLQNAPGFVPVIINIRPMTDLKGFLGIVNQTA